VNDDTSSGPTPAPAPGTASHGPFDRWFRPVQVPREAEEGLRALAERGSVVYVMRSPGLLNFLYLRWLLRRLRLPPIACAAGFSGFWGFVVKVRRTRLALADAVERGRSALVFLGQMGHRDPFATLVATQRRARHPVFLVPLLLVWSRRAPRLKPRLRDILFGSPETPSPFATAVAFLANYRRAFLRVGRALDLETFVRERAAEPDPLLARKARGAVHHYLARELRAALGPPLKAPARVREKVLRDKSLQRVLAHASQQGGRSIKSATEEALKDLREIASRYSPAFIAVARSLLHWFFIRRFERVEVDEEGLARIRRAAGEAPLVLCPSHKSHVDYLIISYVFYEAGLTPPHIAAGLNLAFWPFGSIARLGGAFFIRRSFRGDKIYSATLRAYVKHLMRDGFAQEFFPEGGRSRTGKLLFPMTGLFSMEVDAWLDGAASDVTFVPIAVDYEELLEATSMAREISGGEKKKETFGALLRTPRFLLRRYGRIYVQFGEPVSLRALAQSRLGEAAASLTLEDERETDSKRALVRRLANSVTYGIDRAITIAPRGLLAAALLSHVRRGLSAPEVERRVELLRYIARDTGARFASSLAGAPSDPLQPGPIADAMAKLAAEKAVRVERAAGETIYQVVDERRPLLDYQRNTVLHRYVAVSLVSAAVRACGPDAALADARSRSQWLSRLFKLEFMYRVGAGFDQVFSDTLGFLERLEVVAIQQERLRAGTARETLDFLADLTRSYLEAYRLAAETLAAAGRMDGPLDRRSLVKSALERGRAGFLAGRIVLREALSKATLENAFEWLAQQGAIGRGPDGKPSLTPEWRSRSLADLIEELDHFLGH
jgi:glycerol-3-phosphate O-acyltransferase